MSVSEEEMHARLKASVLDENRPVLCKNLDPKLHYPYLRSKYVLSEEDEELIEVQPIRQQKVHKFIDILMKKGRPGYDELIKSIIQERTQIFLAKQLNQAFEEKVKRLRALLAANNNMRDSSLSQIPADSLKQSTDASPIKIMDLPNFDSLQSSTDTVSSLVSDSLKSSCSDIGVDTDKLPVPVMKQKVVDIETLKLSRKESCENSFDEDLEDNKSLTDSVFTSGSESRA